MKTCTRCKQEKALEEFNKRSRSKDGIDIYCKTCRKSIQYYSRKYNKNKCSWNECDRPNWCDELCQMHFKRKLSGKPMDERKDHAQKYVKIKQRYKLDKETYDEMAKDGCYICGSIEFLNVDHDHACCSSHQRTCGKCVRGIVCASCNIHLGKLEKGTIALVNELKPKLYQYLIDFETRKKSLG
jgi:hypothetical protein